MYNENVAELMATLNGLNNNYIEMGKNGTLKKYEFLVFIICDGYDQIKEEFKQHAEKYNFI